MYSIHLFVVVVARIGTKNAFIEMKFLSCEFYFNFFGQRKITQKQQKSFVFHPNQKRAQQLNVYVCTNIYTIPYQPYHCMIFFRSNMSTVKYVTFHCSTTLHYMYITLCENRKNPTTTGTQQQVKNLVTGFMISFNFFSRLLRFLKNLAFK